MLYDQCKNDKNKKKLTGMKPRYCFSFGRLEEYRI